MGRVRFRVWGAVASVATAALLAAQLPGPGTAQAAAATTNVVVRGTAFPDPLTAQLSLAGCATMSAVSPESPQPRIGIGPGVAPSGQRSLGFDLAGGNAVGALFMRPSMAATTTADLQVHAEAGARGVAYAGYQAPADDGTVRVWVGRADVVATASGWQRVDATRLAYTWTKRDLKTGAQLLPGPAAALGVGAFMAGHGGDGAGFYTLGFGCDGRPFSLDTFRVGTAGSVRSYDLEGLATTTTISGRHDVVAGDPVRLTGSVRDQSGARIPDGTLVLEQRSSPGAPWETVFRDDERLDPVVVDADGSDPVVELVPERTTSYRFRFADRPLAEGSASAPFQVNVTPVLSARATAEREVVGRIRPAVPGAVVTLWPAGSTSGGALARAEVDAEGRYELNVPREVGGDLVVRFGGAEGLEPATSDPVQVEALVRAPGSPAVAPGQSNGQANGQANGAPASSDGPAPAGGPAGSSSTGGSSNPGGSDGPKDAPASTTPNPGPAPEQESPAPAAEESRDVSPAPSEAPVLDAPVTGGP